MTEIWVIYCDPNDFPGEVLAIMWLIAPGKMVRTNKMIRFDVTVENPEHITGEQLKDVQILALRETIQSIKPGAQNFGRSADDDPCIVETWC